MGLYERYILPRCTDWVCRSRSLTEQRKTIVPLARGYVLEIGIGTGLNLAFYDPTKVKSLVGIDPSPHITTIAEKRATSVPFGVEFLSLSSESIPIESDSIDTVLVTYTLCTINNVVRALEDMRRVLKPAGELIFLEHGRSPERNILRLQNQANPVWKWISRGCNLNRNIPSLIEQGGFKITEMRSG